MSQINDFQAARKLLAHKDFGLMSLLKEFLKIEGFYSDLGAFLSGEDVLYLSFFFKVKECGNTVYKLNINLEDDLLENSCKFKVGFEKNNHKNFDKADATLKEIKEKITAKIPPEILLDDLDKTIPLGIYFASDISQLVSEILKNYGRKTDDDLADVSSGDFITLTKANKIVKKHIFLQKDL